MRGFGITPSLFPGRTLKNATHTSPGNPVESNQSDDDFDTPEVFPDHSRCYVLIHLFFSGLLHLQDLHKKEETMVFEAHGMSFPCTELLLFNYAKVKTVFHSMAPLMAS